MRSPADNAVIARERELPGIGWLLDEERFAEMLRGLCPDREIGAARAGYLRYKPGTSCLVAYAVEVDGETVSVYARCHRDDQGIKLANAETGWEAPGALGPGLLLDESRSVAVFGFPNDYEVRGLRKLHDAERSAVRMRRILHGHEHLHGVTPEMLRYKPERRYVGLCRSQDGPAAVLRLYTDALYAEVRAKAGAIRNTDGLRVPRVVGESERYGALAYEWVEGAPLDGMLVSGRLGHAGLMRGFGASLVELHRQRPRLRSMVSSEDYRRAVLGACGAVAASDEGLGVRAEGLARRVGALLDEAGWSARALHGDLTADQVVYGSGRLHLIDLDRACFGDPRVDVGSMVAGLWLMGATERVDEDAALGLAEAFCEGYWSAAGAGSPADIRAFVAGALLLMAPEPFRFRTSEWFAETERVLGVVEGVLTGASLAV